MDGWRAAIPFAEYPSHVFVAVDACNRSITGILVMSPVPILCLLPVLVCWQIDGEQTENEQFELRVIGNSVTFEGERDLSKGLAKAASLKRAIRKAALPSQRLKKQISDLETRMKLAQQQMVGLNAQLANVNSVAANNRLVGAINALEGQMQLARQGLEELKEQEKQARAALAASQEEYVENILAMRELVDRLNSEYEARSDDSDIARQVAEFEKARGKEFAFGPSNTWRSNGRKLADLEESITLERIPLRGDSGTFYATVVVNGEHTAEMVVDSGASMITLPFTLASRMGMEPRADDQRILLTIADGSTITGYVKTAKSVRVGTFELNDVRCAVLGPDATNAEPLLGMSFLGEFQFDLDAADETLGLIRIEEPKSRR